jgi:hypothetical protein
MRKKGGAYNKPLDYTITYNGLPPYTIQTMPYLFEVETTYQNILSYLNDINFFEFNKQNKTESNRVDLHVTHLDGSKTEINMFNPGRQSEKPIQNGDVMKLTMHDVDPFLARWNSQTRKGGKLRNKKRKTRRKTRRLSSL